MHGAKFFEQWSTFVHDKPCTIRADHKGNGTAVITAVFEGGIEADFGLGLSLELGEFFYQLRAALDGATFKLASLLSAPHPPPNETTLEFPIYPTTSKFNQSAFCKQPFSDEFKAWVESIQPYNAHKTTDKPYRGINHALSLLHDCARKDRHRQLHVVAALPTTIKGHFVISPPGRITFTEMIPCNFLEDKFEFLRFGFDRVTDGDIDLKGEMVIEVSVQEIPDRRGTALVEEVNRFLDVAAYVINAFEAVQKGDPLIF